MATDLGHLKSVRAGHKGAVSRKMTDLNALLVSTPVDRDSLERIKLALERKLDLLNKLSEDIVAALTDEGEIIAEIESAELVSDDIEEALLKIKRALDPPRSTPPPPIIPPPSHPTSPVPLTSHAASPSPPPVDPLASSPPVTAPTSTLRVKLPELSLHPFDGNFANWFTFWDTYKAAIHDNAELSDIGKFTYLISLLRHSAKEAIAGLSLTAANYREAIEILCKRFGDRTQIRANHMEVLMSLEPVMSSQNLSGLRRLYDTVETNIRGLKSLGVDRESYGTLLSPVILKKLPQDLRLIISRQVADDEWNLDSILRILLSEIEARERAGIPNNSKPRRDRERPTGVNLYTGTSSSKSSCCYCNGDHNPSQCETVTSVNERQKILRRHGRCYNCLRKGHIVRECKSSSCKVCKAKHHTSLCQKPTGQSNSGQSGSTNLQISTFELNPTALPFSPGTSLESSKAVGSNSTSTLHVENENAVLLQTACAVVFNPTNHDFHEEVRVILDCGSQRSYITNSLRKRLQLVSEGKKAMSIMTFGSTKVRKETCDLVRVGVRAKESDFELRLLSVPHICSPIASMPVETCRSKYSYLRELDLADTLPDGELEILIGSDYYWKVVTGERIQSSHGPVAIYTRLGWVLSGPIPHFDGPYSTNLITHVLRVDSGPTFRELDKHLKAFWELESLGIRDSEDIVHEQFCSIVTLREGRYEVSLPWKDSFCTIPDHFELCSRRLNSLLRRLRRTPEILKEYHRIIQQQLENGIVEVVEKPHEVTDGRVHYLPHHAVIRRDKETTKVRIVYDASARESGPSLNDILYTGPKFNQKIFDILLRFRCHQIALTSDIEKAFLMISIAEKDRNALRFLWVKNPLEESSDYTVLRFTRVVFGVSSSPFLLNATVHYHLTLNLELQKALVSKLLRSFYVDDVITGANTVKEAFSLYTESKELMRRGGFNLCKFNTNDPALQERISLNEGTCTAPEADETYTQMALNKVQTKLRGERKVLGLIWNVDDDEIVYDLRNVVDTVTEVGPTKRQIVSLTGRFFDPIGVLAPVVITFKVLIQELCKAGVGWDEPLEGESLERWRLLIQELRICQPIHIPRCYSHSVLRAYELHGFCDASTTAYAAVVYLLVKGEGDCTVKIIASKSRVAPLQTQTIPRLELLGALLLSRLVKSVINSIEMEIDIRSFTCYTDSLITLYWIKGLDRDWKPFVQNRVSEIRHLTGIDNWRHCPGELNPADISSRGLRPSELQKNNLWWNGPSFICLEDINMIDTSTEVPEGCLSEMKSKVEHTLEFNTFNNHSISNIMNIENYSTVKRVLNITMILMKFIDKLRKNLNNSDVDYLNRAEQLWLQDVQSTLVNGKYYSQLRRQLDLFCDEKGVWRCGGRLTKAEFSYATKHPIILPRDHYYTLLVVKQAHCHVLHSGTKETLTQVRSRYWIAKGRTFVKRVLAKCVVCKRYGGLAYKAPPPPPLPSFRVNKQPPFTYTGVDYAGPLHVKPDHPIGAKCDQKIWICLYTCCITRAVHLDIVPNLSCSSFLRSFRRFTSRRGTPLKVISDNGTTFTSAARVINSIVTDRAVSEYMSGLRVDWRFNVEKAPWWGGLFERMIGLMKRCLRKIIGRSGLTYDELLTAIIEVESILNSRPLCFIASDDLEEPLTPSHLITGRRLTNIPDELCYRRINEEFNDEVSPTLLNRRLRYLHAVLDKFWVRWRDEYLLSLRERYSREQKSCSPRKIKVGDVVIVHSDEKARSFWKLGRVEEIIMGADGNARGGVVRLLSKGKRTTLLKRPVQKLIPLEVEESPEMEESPDIERTDPTVDASEKKDEDDREGTVIEDGNRKSTRLRRIAAVEARDKILARLCEN